MQRRLFPFDKNYILKEAQHLHRPFLLQYTHKKVCRYYFENHNPLGIIDDTIKTILDCENPRVENLEYIYDCLAGIYRFKHGETQLEFLFEGQSHFEKYSSEWKAAYKKWIKHFCQYPTFIKAVLEATVFYPEERKSVLAINRLKAFVDDHFDLKIYKYRGIVVTKSA